MFVRVFHNIGIKQGYIPRDLAVSDLVGSVAELRDDSWGMNRAEEGVMSLIPTHSEGGMKSLENPFFVNFHEE